MADLLHWVWGNVVVFLAILTVVVFVHEMGHFLLARACGVKVLTFSIGFGPEIWGRTARNGTRWRISLLPLGGYVKMLGDADAASTPGSLDGLSQDELKQTFQIKKLWQKALIIAAGPVFNLIFGLAIAAVGFMLMGEVRIAPVVGGVTPGSAAEEAGVQAGDRILTVNGKAVAGFQDVQMIVGLNVGDTITLQLRRGDQVLTMDTHPRITELKDAFGNVQKRPLLGVRSDPSAAELIKHGPLSAVAAAGRETMGMISATLTGVGQMMNGSRSTDGISGPIRIAKGAGQAAQVGFSGVVFYIFLLSINLGLINLFPVPLLDGGHLLFYGIEALMGRPLGARTQEYGFRIGLFLVLALMLLATRNDIVDLLHGS
ncbi:MAG TPA: RIP metalloprotease RseP [Candidatus Sulfotelmatobacter sp.]|jgi:regulator of sigma E protease|nr:RIP metalloprotease RseP [Candidatus Sulfotelmatobacter sp.]